TTGVRGLIKPQWVRKGQVILALSNPDPEIEPLIAREQGAALAADGKGINNVLAFPGLFKGALAARARSFTDAMLMAAANAIAGFGGRGDGGVPAPRGRRGHGAVAAAVGAAAADSAGSPAGGSGGRRRRAATADRSGGTAGPLWRLAAAYRRFSLPY